MTCSSYLVVRYAGTGRLGQGGLPCGTATCRWIMPLADPFRTAHPTPKTRVYGRTSCLDLKLYALPLDPYPIEHGRH